MKKYKSEITKLVKYLISHPIPIEQWEDDSKSKFCKEYYVMFKTTLFKNIRIICATFRPLYKNIHYIDVMDNDLGYNESYFNDDIPEIETLCKSLMDLDKHEANDEASFLINISNIVD